ncbi:MAG: tRNA pseudouridine(55) synthase TruB [Pseudomonadota bacterium]|nr:tRNA pseudouridine(55) synthase TruB [Pseudomonadota bacterium]
MIAAKPQPRDVHGIVLLDKPVGMTSNAALQAVRRLFRARKAGHTGSLDPLAGGLLPLCLGEATKVSGFLLNGDKTYRFVCRLGETTTTGDAEGGILATRPVGALDQDGIAAVLARFTGDILQTPPMHSAVRHQGQRLYTLARQGLEVERQPRRVTVHALRLIALDGPYLTCETRCSKGTYVRVLAQDIGEALGCGAHVVELRRTGVEPYDAGRMLTLEALRDRAEQGLAALDAVLLPIDSALAGWPAVRVPGDSAHHLRRGESIFWPQAAGGQWVRLYDDEARFFGIGEVLDGRLALRRLVRGQGGGLFPLGR